MSVQRRLNLGFAALFLLFMAFLLVQFGVGGRQRDDHDRMVDRITRAEVANDQALQWMTDAETAVRGFQLTGERLFLEPYETGWRGALSSLEQVGAETEDGAVRELLDRERDTIRAWLDMYADPIVTADRIGVDPDRAEEGKRLFDELRLVNESVERAVHAERQAAAAAAVDARGWLQLVSTVLVTAILGLGYAIARTGRRQLLAPLGHLGQIIRKLTAGDRSARAMPVGADEMRTVIEALNDLAEQTETLLAAEHARATRAGLRQAVSAEMQEMRHAPTTARRVADLIGGAVGADTVHGELVIPVAGAVKVRWPSRAPDLPAETVTELLGGASGEPVIRLGGGFAVTLCADTDEPGYLLITRAGAAWSEAEHRLLTGVTKEIERALRRLTLQRQQARLISELRLLDQRKDVFIQTVTHELRTPLTSILGYTEMLLEDGDSLSPLQRRSLDAILRNAHRLHDTIGDLVLLDRPGTADSGLDEPLDLASVAATVHGELTNAAHAKNLTVTFAADEAWVRGDRTQLQRALRKLMENAIKFTPSGGSVTCRLATAEGSITLSVADTGIGIPAEDVPGLFTPFHRAGNAMDQAVQGPGLGLAIVRDIIRDHGGSIAVQSVVGRGSTFTITLPAVAAPIPAPV